MQTHTVTVTVSVSVTVTINKINPPRIERIERIEYKDVALHMLLNIPKHSRLVRLC
jgi:hypothetical protein